MAGRQMMRVLEISRDVNVRFAIREDWAILHAQDSEKLRLYQYQCVSGCATDAHGGAASAWAFAMMYCARVGAAGAPLHSAWCGTC